MRKPIALIALLPLATVLPAQTTHVVAEDGSGNFTTIAAAITAAQPGDSIVVRSGAYVSFTVDKGVLVVADPNVIITGTMSASIFVRDVPAGQVAVVRGFTFLFGLGQSLIVRDNQGHVHLEGMTAPNGIAIADSAQVSLHAVNASASPAADVQRSTVSFTGCTLAGINTVFTIHPGLRCTDATVLLAHTRVSGSSDPFGFTGSGPGVQLERSTVAIGGSGSTVAAGNAPAPLATSAILASSGTLRLDPSVPLAPINGAPALSGGASVRLEPVPTIDGDVQGAVLTATAEAPVGSTSFIVLALAGSPPVALPFGNLWIGSLHAVLGAATVGPSGKHSASLPNLPPLPPGFSVVLQGVVVDGGVLRLSNPTALSIDT